MQTQFKPTKLAVLTGLALGSLAYASTVRTDFDYQYFRDLAENKGRFTAGATHIQVVDKAGQTFAFLGGVPMINFESVIRKDGHSTLVDTQYVHSVYHNVGYSKVNFGADNYRRDAHIFDYLLTDRNNYRLPKPQDPNKKEVEYYPGVFEQYGILYRKGRGDYHTPRLHKLVTEVAPAELSPLKVSETGYNSEIFFDSNRYSHFIRAGAGVQRVIERDGTETAVGGAYSYLTGGTTIPLKSRVEGMIAFSGSVYDDAYSPLSSFTLGGDSGSGFFAYDTQEKKWVYIAALSTVGGSGINGSNNAVLFSPEILDIVKNGDFAGTVNTQAGANYRWTPTGNSSTITQAGTEVLKVDLYDAAQAAKDTETARPSLEHGKTVRFSGENSTITLASDLHQGAGALFFDANATFSGANSEITYVGAGVSVAEGKEVVWTVKNPEGDRLSKIGAGTLIVNGFKGNNGDISVGDGTVVLAQRGEGTGNRQAFNQVGLVSGRGTVVLKDAHQVNPDNLYFGHRGGRLDVNGNSLMFSHIQNVDDGAMIVNHHDYRTSEITITGMKPFALEDLKIKRWAQPEGDLYEYTHPNLGKKASYYRLKGESYNAPFPSPYHTGESNENWEFLSFDKQEALQKVLALKNADIGLQGYNGYFGETDADKPNGKLNVTFAPTEGNAVLLMSGGSRLKGQLNVKGGKVILSGYPTPHARDKINRQDVVYDDEWLDRTFQADAFNVGSAGALEVGRNVAQFNGNLTLAPQAVAHLGFSQGDSVCTRSDYSGKITCDAEKTYADDVFATLTTTQITSNVTLADESRLTLGSKADLSGNIVAEKSAQLTLNSGSHWTMMGDSRLGNLHLDGTLTLNPAFDTPTADDFRTLTIQGNLSGNGVFNIATDIAKLVSDTIVVAGKASGSFKLQLNQNLTEPETTLPIEVFRVESGEMADFSLSLVDEVAKVGDYIYRLTQEGNSFYLSTPHRTQKGESETADPLPVYDGVVETVKNGEGLVNEDKPIYVIPTPEPQPEPTPTPTPAPQPEPTPTPSPAPQPEPTPNPTPQPEPTPTPNPAPQPEPTPTPNPAPQPEPTPTPNPAPQPEPTPTPSPAPQPEPTPTPSPAPQPEPTPTPAPQPEPQPTPTPSWQFAELAAQTKAMLDVSGKLDDILRDKGTENWRVWSDVSRVSATFRAAEGFEQSNHLTRLGLEKALENGAWIGLVLTQSRANSDFDLLIKGKSTLTALSLYGKKAWENGLFVAGDTTFGKAKHRLNAGESRTHLDRRFFSVGATLGKTWDLHGFNLNASAGVRFHHLSREQSHLAGQSFNTDSVNLLSVQTGLSLDKAFDFHGLKIKPSVGVFYVNAEQGKLNSRFNGVSLSQKIGQAIKSEVGLSAQYQGFRLGVSAEFLKGRAMKKQSQLSLKIGYDW